MQERVAFIGLGTMGYPMAGHLAKAGHQVTVYNRTPARTERWLAEFPGHPATTPAEAAREATLVFACVGKDDDVRQITLGPAGAFQAMPAGAVWVDHTTTSALLARELAADVKEKNLLFLDASV